MRKGVAVGAAVAAVFASSAAPPPKRTAAADYTVLIRGGTIYDGSGGAPFVGDVGLRGDKVVFVGRNAPGVLPASSTLPARRCRRASSTCSAGRPKA
jgi:N-acyl-D-amino-acid deacylase